jgi:hypothetical protein
MLSELDYMYGTKVLDVYHRANLETCFVANVWNAPCIPDLRNLTF